MDNIPVSFEIIGNQVNGHFCKVAGSGGASYHLMANKYYYGQIVLSSAYGWQFSSTNDTIHSIGPFFVDHVTHSLNKQI